MRRMPLLLLSLALLATPVVHAASVHRWVDENGRVHFSQTPPADTRRPVQTTQIQQPPAVDPACCQEIGRVGGEVADAFARGYRLVDVHQMFPASRYPKIVEIANFVSDKSSLGYPPASIAGMTETACLNRSLLVCRKAGDGPSGTPGGPPRTPGKAAYGTGFHVTPELVLTNLHVVDGCRLISIGESTSAVHLQAADAQRDLALLRTAQPGSASVSLRAEGALELGESLLVAGYPLRHILGSLNITTGNVSALSGMAGSSGLFQISAPIQPGSSGGPVLDRFGQLIGVVVSKLSDSYGMASSGSVPQNVNFAIQLPEVRAFLDAQGVRYASAPSAAQPLEQRAISRAAQAYTVAIRCEY